MAHLPPIYKVFRRNADTVVMHYSYSCVSIRHTVEVRVSLSSVTDASNQGWNVVKRCRRGRERATHVSFTGIMISSVAGPTSQVGVLTLDMEEVEEAHDVSSLKQEANRQSLGDSQGQLLGSATWQRNR